MRQIKFTMTTSVPRLWALARRAPIAEGAYGVDAVIADQGGHAP